MSFPFPAISPPSNSAGINAKASSFTAPNNTNNQAVTGVGFQPNLVMQTMTRATSTGNTLDRTNQFGAAVSSSQRVAMGPYLRNSLATMQTGASFRSDRFAVAVNNSDVTIDEMDFVSQDSDGFTVDWNEASLFIVPYLALGGISAKVGTFDLNNSTGNQAVTGVGFQPKTVLFFTTIANTTEDGRADAYFCFGAMDSSGNQWSIAARDRDALADDDSAHLLDNTKCFTQISTAAVLAACGFVSMDGDGFTVNVTTAPGASIRIGYVAIGGGSVQAKVGTLTQKATTGTQAYTGVGFQPAALIFGISEVLAASLGTVVVDWHAGIGFATGSSNQNYSMSTSQDGAPTSVTAARLVTNKCLGEMAVGSSHTVTAEAGLSSMDSDGFTLDWTTSDGNLRVFGYVALR